MEQKSERVQQLLLNILFDLIELGDSINIQTPSFNFLFKKIISTELKEIKHFWLPSFNELVNGNHSSHYIAYRVLNLSNRNKNQSSEPKNL